MKHELAAVPSLSCVENYFLAWCRRVGIEPGLLYAESWMPLAETLKAFLSQGCRYESFDRIPRVQDTAERLGFAEHSFRWMERQEGELKSDLALCGVTEEFFGRSSLVPWRKDHYIWVTENRGGVLSYLNNYPLSGGKMTAEEAERYLSGRVLTFRRKAGGDEPGAVALGCRQLEAISAGSPACEPPGWTEYLALRDAIGVAKAVMRRMEVFFREMARRKKLVYDGELEQHVAESASRLERLYGILEVLRLRGTRGDGRIEEYCGAALEAERKLCGMVKMRRMRDEQDRYF